MVEAQAQANLAVNVVTRTGERVSTVQLKDKVERTKRLNDVIVCGIPFVGNERFHVIIDVVLNISAKCQH